MNFLKYIKSKLLKGHTRSVKVKKNILILLFVKGYSVIINLLLIPFTLNLLDNYRYGVWITILNILSFIHLFEIDSENPLTIVVPPYVAHRFDTNNNNSFLLLAYTDIIYDPLDTITYEI